MRHNLTTRLSLPAYSRGRTPHCALMTRCCHRERPADGAGRWESCAATISSHYRALATEAQGKAWFALVPSHSISRISRSLPTTEERMDRHVRGTAYLPSWPNFERRRTPERGEAAGNRASSPRIFCFARTGARLELSVWYSPFSSKNRVGCWKTAGPKHHPPPCFIAGTTATRRSCARSA